jgi:hypothetical protein
MKDAMDRSRMLMLVALLFGCGGSGASGSSSKVNCNLILSGKKVCDEQDFPDEASLADSRKSCMQNGGTVVPACPSGIVGGCRSYIRSDHDTDGQEYRWFYNDTGNAAAVMALCPDSFVVGP